MQTSTSWVVIVTPPAAPRKLEIDNKEKDNDICNVPNEMSSVFCLPCGKARSMEHIRTHPCFDGEW
jgi:hypothetical protein